MVHGVHLLGFMDSKVLQECNDILQLQEQMCNKLQEKLKQSSCCVPQEDYKALKEALQSEKVSHQKTCVELEQEREHARLDKSELAILKRQLNREKETFENAFGILKSQALTDSSKAEDLLAKCSGLEALCAKKDEEIANKQQTIVKLQQRLRTVEEKHHRELMEVQVQAQQDAYVAKHLSSRQERTGKKS